MALGLIVLPPLFVLLATAPWWLRAVFRWWLGVVNPSWDDHAHGHSRRPSRLHLVSGAADAELDHGRQPRHLRLVRGSGGEGLDPVA